MRSQRVWLKWGGNGWGNGWFSTCRFHSASQWIHSPFSFHFSDVKFDFIPKQLDNKAKRQWVTPAAQGCIQGAGGNFRFSIDWLSTGKMCLHKKYTWQPPSYCFILKTTCRQLFHTLDICIKYYSFMFKILTEIQISLKNIIFGWGGHFYLKKSTHISCLANNYISNETGVFSCSFDICIMPVSLK